MVARPAKLQGRSVNNQQRSGHSGEALAQHGCGAA
jgi:hypothetical protein